MYEQVGPCRSTVSDSHALSGEVGSLTGMFCWDGQSWTASAPLTKTLIAMGSPERTGVTCDRSSHRRGWHDRILFPRRLSGERESNGLGQGAPSCRNVISSYFEGFDWNTSITVQVHTRNSNTTHRPYNRTCTKDGLHNHTCSPKVLQLSFEQLNHNFRHASKCMSKHAPKCKEGCILPRVCDNIFRHISPRLPCAKAYL
eukprot:1155930-Pelagomonas_calceolata.AAC.4